MTNSAESRPDDAANAREVERLIRDGVPRAMAEYMIRTNHRDRTTHWVSDIGHGTASTALWPVQAY